MRRFGAVAIRVLPIVLETLHGVVERRLDEANILADPWEVRKFQWRAVLLDNVHERDIVKQQLMFPNLEFFLWKFEGLFDEFTVALHFMYGVKNAILE